MEVGKRLISDHNHHLVVSKKQRTHQLFNAGVYLPPATCRVFPPPHNNKLIDCILPCDLPLNKNYYILPDGRILGLIIHLTTTTTTPGNNNNNYCNDNLGLIKQVKIQIPCDDSVPSNESVNFFVHQIKMFVMQNQICNNKKYVLVYGSNNGYNNQIGYMIVHYLMRTRLISVTQAIQIFADTRPPGIFKSEYIQSLYIFYHEMIKPEWKIQDLKQKQNLMKSNDVIGDNIPYDQEHILKNICYDLLKLPKEELNQNQRFIKMFPGSNPVSLNKENIELLKQRVYYASWKPKGTRYMMLIAMDGTYLIDSEFNFKRVQMRFPLSIENKSHHLTLLDGEMVIDKLNKTGESVRRYLVTDIMSLNSISLVDRKFHERWDIIDKDVIQPRKNKIKNKGYIFSLEPFSVRRKDYWNLSWVPKILKELIPVLSHESDGLIFQGWDDPYIPYTNKFALKWKNPEMESLCFLYKMNEEEDQLLYVVDKGEMVFIAANRILFGKDCNSSPEYVGKIVECYWDDEKKMWICLGMRSDRIVPDEYEKYVEMVKRFWDSVDDEMLVNEIGKV